MRNVKLIANAKINLTLDITGKRQDGYHEVEMIMQSVSLADEVEITLAGGGETQVFCDNPQLPQGRGNLAFRAAESFFACAGVENPGIRIHIKKHIPASAGLAGGSADAAAVFAGLNTLLGADLDGGALAQAARGIGVDIPFCLRGGTMLAQGIGERLTPLHALPDCPIVIVKPAQSVSTAAAYAAFDRLSAVTRPETAKVCAEIAGGDISGVARQLCNVFEAASGLPVTAEIKEVLRAHGALGACMSGSGSAVFGLFDDSAAAQSCISAFKGTGNEVFLCRPADFGCAITG